MNIMVNTYAILGLGMMGEAIVFDILSHEEGAVVLGFEINEARRKELDEKFKHFGRFISFDLNLDLNEKSPKLVEILKKKGVGVTFGAIDYKYNEYLTKICIEASSNFLDLGGNPNIVAAQRRLDGYAKSKGLTIIPDCGLAPGMADVLAASIMYDYDTLETCAIRVGGLPQKPETILKYQQVFSIRGLTNEYLEDAEVIRDGKLTTVPSLSELEEINFEHFDLPPLEAFQTAGGTSSLPLLFEGKVKSLDYKTIRYKGHCQFIQFLKDFELLSSEPYKNTNPREVIEHYLQKNLPKGNPDYVLVKIVVRGVKSGSNVETIYEILDRSNEETGFSSMARTTAYPISIIGIMIANGEINEKGVVPGEKVIPYNRFVDELKLRNIIIKSSEKTY